MSPFYRVSAFTLLVIAAGLLSCTEARAETVDRIVANVNGQIILYSDLQNQIKVMAKSMPTLDVTDPTKKSRLEREVLTQMVRQKLADAEVERLKVVVSDLEVEQKLKEILDQNNSTMVQLQLNLKANGQTIEKFHDEIKKNMERDLLIERVLKSKVVISDSQVEAFLKSEKAEDTSSSQKVHLGLIVLPVGDKYGKPGDVEKTGREIVEKLKNGADFQTMARQYSKGPAAQDGGDLGYMAVEDLAPYIAQGLRNLKVDQVSGLVQGPGGYYIIKILGIDAKRVDKSDPTQREKVRRTLYEQEMNRKFEEWVHDLESKAFIQISL